MMMMMVFLVIEKVPDRDASFQHSHATCKQPYVWQKGRTTAQTIVHTLQRLNKRFDLFFVKAVYSSQKENSECGQCEAIAGHVPQLSVQKMCL